jgi:hypothetical protein
LASSGTPVPPPAAGAAAGAASFLALSGALPPQLVSMTAQATPAPIQIFFMLVGVSFSKNRQTRTSEQGIVDNVNYLVDKVNYPTSRLVPRSPGA